MFKTYVPLQGTYDCCYAKKDVRKFDLEKEITENFIKSDDPNKKLLLVLGRSGSGKNIAVRLLYNKLINSYDA